MLGIPKQVVVSDIAKVLADIKHQRCLSQRDTTRVFPVKRLRNSLIEAMRLNVATQPAGAVQRHGVPNTLREGKTAKQTVIWNPVWDSAPEGAFLKARKYCSLVTAIVLNYNGSGGVLKKLERLSTVMWNMSKRHFLGLCRSVRAEMPYDPVRVITSMKSPEALARTRALTRNPAQCREKRNFVRKGLHSARCAAMRLSYKVWIVRDSLRCTKCRVAAVAATWFNRARDLSRESYL
jgi:hypothetical protein